MLLVDGWLLFIVFGAPGVDGPHVSSRAPAEGHMGCLWVGAVRNKVAVNILPHWFFFFLCECKSSFLWDNCLCLVLRTH